MITRIAGGQEVELRTFALSDMVRYGYQGLRSIEGTFSEAAVRGLPAIHRAARIRAEATASLQLRCWRGEGPELVRVDDIWQARLFRGPACDEQTRFGFWETVGESLAYRNNGYIWKNVDPLTSRVTDWYALHPDQVQVMGCDSFRVTVRGGYVDPVGKGPASYDVGCSTLLHIRGHGGGGMIEAPSPVQIFKDALIGPIERQRHEARMWRRGTSIQQAVILKESVTPDQADSWRSLWRDTYEGTEGGTTAVLGGGADIKPIGMSAADAQFVEMAHLTVEDASRIMGVPANLLGAPTQTGKTKATLEEDLMTWLRFGLGPELERIESALAADEVLFGNTTARPGFDTDAVVRGDILTEATVLQQRVQSGILTPDEARQILGYGPHPDGVGAIPQITPVGGTPNPDLSSAQAPPQPAVSGSPT